MDIIERAISAFLWLIVASRVLPRVAGNAEGGIFLISFFLGILFFLKFSSIFLYTVLVEQSNKIYFLDLAYSSGYTLIMIGT